MTQDGHTEGEGPQLFYRVFGSRREDGAPLVLLHGGPGGSHDLFIPCAGPLAETRQVILYDQRGCGRSSALAEDISCTLADNVADLEHLRSHLDLGSMDVLGHSWGGLLGMAYALEHGKDLRRLILVAPALPYYPNASWSEFLATLSPDRVAQIAEIRRDPRRSPAARQAAVWRATVREFFHRREVLESLDLEKMPFSPQVGVRVAEDLEGLDLRPRLRTLSVPTLILAGRHDRRLPVKHHERLAELLPDATLRVFEDSGHFPFLEEKEAFASAVDAFLEKP